VGKAQVTTAANDRGGSGGFGAQWNCPHGKGAVPVADGSGLRRVNRDLESCREGDFSAVGGERCALPSEL
jgi:hypothetical protein